MHNLIKFTVAALACSASLACASQTNDAWVGSGIASASVDAASLVRDSIASRLNQATLLKRHSGGSVWGDVNGKIHRNDTLLNGHGSKAKTFVANLGADIKTEDLLFGVVYSAGRTDVKTRRTTLELEGDSDFYGVKFYAEQAIGLLRINAAMGWMHQHGHAQRAPGSSSCAVRSDIWSLDLGVATDLVIGNTLITPYLQAQTTLLDPNDWRGGQADHATFYSFPVGVNIRSLFAVGNYTVMPMMDLSVTTNTGDTQARWSANQQSTTTRFISDTVSRASLGLDIKGDKGSCGLTYLYADGDGQDREHAILLRSSYTF